MTGSTEGTVQVLTLEPILAVRDVAATVAYWRDVLGFEEVWLFASRPPMAAPTRTAWRYSSV